jgi:hypothetical protein
LIELREALADFSDADANDGVVAGLVVGAAAEDLGADDALAEEVLLLSEGVFDDVAEQGLALLAEAKGRAGQYLVEHLVDAGWVDSMGVPLQTPSLLVVRGRGN